MLAADLIALAALHAGVFVVGIIELDLDDGVKVNYRKLQTANDGKFYEVLADSKNIMSKK